MIGQVSCPAHLLRPTLARASSKRGLEKLTFTGEIPTRLIPYVSLLCYAFPAIWYSQGLVTSHVHVRVDSWSTASRNSANASGASNPSQ